jgi:hypothetical protein
MQPLIATPAGRVKERVEFRVEDEVQLRLGVQREGGRFDAQSG